MCWREKKRKKEEMDVRLNDNWLCGRRTRRLCVCVCVCVCVWIALNNRKIKKKKGRQLACAGVLCLFTHEKHICNLKKKKTNREKTRRHHTICSDCPLFSFFFLQGEKYPLVARVLHMRKEVAHVHTTATTTTTKKKKLSSLISSGLFCFESFPPPLYM